MLLAFCFQLMSTCIVMISFSSVSTVVAAVYGVSETMVSLAYTFFFIFTILLNFPATLSLEKFGLAINFRAAALIIIVACWLRWLLMVLTNSFAFLLFGQGLVAISQPFIYNGISKIATRWFPDNERARATTFASLSDPLGIIVGMVLSPFFIQDSDKDDPEEGKNKINKLLLVQAILCTVLSIPMLLFIREKPQYYPSAAAMKQ